MYSGGSIWTGRNQITLTDNVFTGSIARGGHGGGIFAEAGPVTIMGSTFNTNLVPWDPGFDRLGGTVATESGELTITNSQFNGNSSGTGGSVAALTGTVTITNSTFTGNLGNEVQMEHGGGGLWIGYGNGYLINSVFSGNSAHSGGGGAYTAYGDITITQCAFLDNVAEDGGGLGAFHGSAPITNSTFAGNLARGSGGAISSRSRAKIRHTTIVGNSAQDRGGLGGTSYTLAQTILAENISENGVDSEDYYGSLTSKGYNIIDYRIFRRLISRLRISV